MRRRREGAEVLGVRLRDDERPGKSGIVLLLVAPHLAALARVGDLPPPRQSADGVVEVPRVRREVDDRRLPGVAPDSRGSPAERVDQVGLLRCHVLTYGAQERRTFDPADLAWLVANLALHATHHIVDRAWAASSEPSTAHLLW